MVAPASGEEPVHCYARKDSTDHMNLMFHFRHMLGAQTFGHFSDSVREHLMVAVPP